MSNWPLTAAQLGIWLGQAKQPTSTRYNTAEYVELNVPINAEDWLLTASRVLQSTTAINVRFIEHQGVPTTQLLSEAERVAKLGDYIDLSESDDAAFAAQQLLIKWQTQPYDLANGDLYRHVLIRLATNHYYWALGAHHIAMDGFSFALVSNRVIQAYEGAQVTADETQYQAVITEDSQYRQSKWYQQDRLYWQQQLQGLDNAAALTTQVLNTEADKEKVTTQLSATLLNQLEARANSVDANWSELLLTAVSAIVYQRTGVAKTIMGMPVANRMASKAANTPCMHMNIVPVPVDFVLVDNFEGLIRQVSEQLRQARRHFRYRYEDLKAEAAILQLPTRLFGAVVNILPFERHETCQGEAVTSHTVSAGPVEDIAFIFIKQMDGSIRFEIEGNQSGYSKAELLSIQSETLQFLHTVAVDLQMPLRVTNRDFAISETPAPVAQSDVLSCLLELSRKSPKSIAVQTIDGHAISYERLVQQVLWLAKRLRVNASVVDGTVLLALPRSQYTVIAMWAVFAAQHRFVFIDNEAPSARNRSIIADAKPCLALVDDSSEGLAEIRDAGVTQLNIASELANAQLEALAATPSILPLLEQAYLIYTSGSTGKPKGVQISHDALAGFVSGARQAYQVGAQDRVLQFAPFHFDTCIEEVFVTLTAGATLILRNDAMLESFEDFLAELENQRITILDLPTAYWHELCRHLCATRRMLPVSIHTIIIGGEAVNRQRVEAWREQFKQSVRLLNTYGPTEATVVATAIDLSKATNPSLIGLPLPGRGAVVMREKGQIAKFGERGELWLTGVGLSSGYLGLAEQTAAAFVSFWDPQAMRSIAAYRTGDIVRMHKSGQLEYLGRVDAQLKISGYRIEIGEIEAVLLGVPAILEAAVTVVKNAQGSATALAAHIVSTTAWALNDLRTVLSEQLPAPMLPAQLYQYEALPKTPANKIDRKRLSEQQNAVCDAEVMSDFETQIAAVWREVLGVSNVRLADNFFSIGGQSLQCIQVAGRLTQLLNKTVNVAFLFAHPKLVDLCNALQLGDELAHKTNTDIATTIKADLAQFRDKLLQVQPHTLPETSEETVLLTGATGFVGAQLLAHLLAKPDLSVICSVRANNIEHGFERLQQAFDVQNLGEIDSSRVTLLLGDIAASQLGLSDADYQQLGMRVTRILHNAAHTSVLRDYSSLKVANTDATAELLMFAKYFSLPFNHVSTIAVAPQSGEPLDEAFIPYHSGLHDGYQQSKWVAEAMVEIAIQQGVAAQVYRLARVTGAKQSGYINHNDLVWRILRSGLKFHRLPELAVSEPWTPVDRVAKFVSAQTLTPTTAAVFNVTPQTLVSLPELYQWLIDFGFVFKVESLLSWLAVLEQSKDEEDLAIASFFTSQPQQSQKATTLVASNQNFISASLQHDASLQSFVKADLARYLIYAFASNLLKIEHHPEAYKRLQTLQAKFSESKEELS
ncbi:non-ribosomal peptide synthetase [Pseudoalteromonas piscicida]|uniref:non-ribosomal peptide synthetase n=1 Tax=Pseudoalteromonas piscicida TaxID=43662 RepID=UPI0005FA3637|nr:non-ribosomal peptide synthetase [Pseudoalteromonas piscicida]KJZ02489.1 long-chain fatty acid--CoA ligase [Pseudoalteromonas piscicida]